MSRFTLRHSAGNPFGAAVRKLADEFTSAGVNEP